MLCNTMVKTKKERIELWKHLRQKDYSSFLEFVTSELYISHQADNKISDLFSYLLVFLSVFHKL